MAGGKVHCHRRSDSEGRGNGNKTGIFPNKMELHDCITKEQRKKPPSRPEHRDIYTFKKETHHEMAKNKRKNSKTGKTLEKTIEHKTKTQITSETTSTRKTVPDSQTEASANIPRQADMTNEPMDTDKQPDTDTFNPSQSKYQPSF